MTFEPGQGGGVVTFDPGQGGRWLIFGVVHSPSRVEVTHACGNITFARFATRAVKR